MAGLRDRLEFDSAEGAVRDGPRRYLLMRPDVLMGVFGRLEAPARAAALEAFAASAREQGGDSLRAYAASLGDDPRALLDATAAAAADLGWGRWSFRLDGERLHLEVANSPFAHGFVAASAAAPPAPVCAPIRGLLEAAAALAFGGEAAAEETACAALGHRCCEFVARRALAGEPVA
jgi:predicted hydrocarbon binding protein